MCANCLTLIPSDMPRMPYEFDIETDSTRVDDGHWQLSLAPHWNIGANPNGGYLLACLLRAMAKPVPDTPDPVAITTHYLRPGLPGQIANLHVSVVRQGRRTATVAGTMEQDGKPRITCTATFAGLQNSTSVTDNSTQRQLLMAPPELPAPEDCISRTKLDQGVALPIMNRLDIRVHPKYTQTGIHHEAEITGWIRFSDKRPVDRFALPLFCDSFPPSVFTMYGPIGWVPTLELSVHVRRRPQSDWIKAAFKTNDLANDLFVEDGMLWDENDQLVAQSRQLQMILS